MTALDIACECLEGAWWCCLAFIGAAVLRGM